MPDTDTQGVALEQRLRETYTEWNNPPSVGLPDGAGVMLEAADTIASLRARAERAEEAFEIAVKERDQGRSLNLPARELQEENVGLRERIERLERDNESYRTAFDGIEPAAQEGREAVEEGWLIEHGDSPTDAPRYWAGSAPYATVSDPLRSSSWTENHMQAIRFARKVDAENVSCRFLRHVPTRICLHDWIGGHSLSPEEEVAIVEDINSGRWPYLQPLATPAPAQPAAQECERCQGNGEIVTDWDRYRRPHDGDVGDEAVAECPDCNGEGTITATAQVVELQARVQPWMMACFGPEISADRLERGDRLLEEVLELLQSGDYPRERIVALTDYTFSRPKGEPHQEVGGVMVTLAAYCLAHDLDMHRAGEDELTRVWTKIDKIRAKQAAKPTGSALPVASPTDADAAVGWRSMDSAPKDGENILYCTKFRDIGFCHWDEGYNDDEQPCWWDNERDDEVCPIAWLPADTLPPLTAAKGAEK